MTDFAFDFDQGNSPGAPHWLAGGRMRRTREETRAETRRRWKAKRAELEADPGADLRFGDTFDALVKVAKSGDVVAVDFDGTCTVDADGTENPRMRTLVQHLVGRGVPVVVFTARPAEEVREWLRTHGWPTGAVTNVKSPDFRVMLDDRAVHFDPAMLADPDLADELVGFKSWWEKGEDTPLYLTEKDMVEKVWDVEKYSADQPRDEDGRWTSGGGGVDVSARTVETDDVEEAARALGEGRRVVLSQPRQVSTLLDRLAEKAREAEAKGEQAPKYDLCNVSVKGTNIFCAGGLGIKRLQMPQLSGKPTPGSPADGLPKNAKGEVDIGPAFLESLRNEGVGVKTETEEPGHLRASQAELNGVKVAGIMGFLRSNPDKVARAEPLFVSRDNYIVDGHHRWAATVGLDYASDSDAEISVPIHRVDMSITELLKRSRDFAEKHGLPPMGFKRKATGCGCEGLPAWSPAAEEAEEVPAEVSPPRIDQVAVALERAIGALPGAVAAALGVGGPQVAPEPRAPRKVRKTVVRDENHRILYVDEEEID